MTPCRASGCRYQFRPRERANRGRQVRPAVYRVGPATPETHAVINSHPAASDFMRIEFKASPSMTPRGRYQAPPLLNETSLKEEVGSDLFKATRVTVASKQATEVAAAAAHPFVLIALTEGAVVDGGTALTIGQERFIAAGGKVTIRNSSDGPIQVLRVDILIKPAAGL